MKNEIYGNPTPYYILHKRRLLDNIRDLKDALGAYWPNAIIGYSFKTNSLPWIVDYMKAKGCYAEVVSDDEYGLARSRGYRLNQMIYNGPAKSKESFLESVK